jgi:nucleoside-diphosphate-sugar epimerase
MKVILTGVTGFIGSEVLAQCREDPKITSIIALTRRPLPESITKDPKIEEIIMEDFTVYSEEVVEKMESADACIWYAPFHFLSKLQFF